MANKNSEWTRHEQVEMDGVTYEIQVRRAGKAFVAAWKCDGCGASGESSLESESGDQAIERAKVSLYAHHILVHRSSDVSESPDV